MPARDRELDAHYLFKAITGGKTFSVGLTHSWVDPETKPDAEDAALALYDIMRATGRPGDSTKMLTKYQFVGVAVAVGTSTGEDDLGNHISPITGSLAGEPPPPNCALLVNKNTGVGGRRNRGRMYFPPAVVDETSVDASGNLFSGGITVYQGLFTAWHAALTSTGWLPLLKHESDITRESTPITGFSVQTVMASQRRRMR